MTTNKMAEFEAFLSDSFREHVYCRELRLSSQEAAYLKEKYPIATLEKYPTGDNKDGKTWYRVNLLGNSHQKQKFSNNHDNDIVTIQKENQRLKQELATIKEALVIYGKDK